jgi:LPS sulfotransferase NodH
MFKSTLSKPQRYLQNFILHFKDLPVYPYGLLPRQDLSKSFILFAQGRTGSTLLGSLLNSHPEIVFEDEILNIDAHRRPFLFPYLYALGRKKMSGASCYGYHVKIYQLSKDHRIDPKRYMHKARADGWKIIYLKRQNLLRHALSSIRAESTRTYFHYVQKKADPRNKGAMHVQPDDLIRRMEERETYLAQENDVLSGLKTYNVTYELDLITPERQQATCQGVFTYLGLDAGDVKVSTYLERINQGSLPDLISNYEEIVSYLYGTRFSRFIEESMSQE